MSTDLCTYNSTIILIASSYLSRVVEYDQSVSF
jgi:hypothetical protein